jgi:hypothetical protein
VFRRIEFFHEGRDSDDLELRTYVSGLMFSEVESPGHHAEAEGVWATWQQALRGPDRTLPQNSRFYFTEKGWREGGRSVVAAAARAGYRYRVVGVKESSVDVVWRDKHTGYEVAAQPLKARR